MQIYSRKSFYFLFSQDLLQCTPKEGKKEWKFLVCERTNFISLGTLGTSAADGKQYWARNSIAVSGNAKEGGCGVGGWARGNDEGCRQGNGIRSVEIFRWRDEEKAWGGGVKGETYTSLEWEVVSRRVGKYISEAIAHLSSSYEEASFSSAEFDSVSSFFILKLHIQ